MGELSSVLLFFKNEGVNWENTVPQRHLRNSLSGRSQLSSGYYLHITHRFIASLCMYTGHLRRCLVGCDVADQWYGRSSGQQERAGAGEAFTVIADHVGECVRV